MAFDISSAKPEQQSQPGQQSQPATSGFDMGTAKPEQQTGVTPNVSSNNIPSAVNNVELLAPTAEPQATLGGDLESIAALASGAIAEPIAGLAGLVSAPFVGVGEAVKNIDSVRDLLTFSPRSDEAKQTLKDIGETLQPVGEALKKTETALGGAVLDATGSPALAAVAHSLPTATLELIGLKGLKGSKLKDAKLSTDVAEAIQQAAPDIKTIKQAATKAYTDLDNLGIKVKPQVYESFANNLSNKLNKEGLDPTLHPKSTATINRILGDVGQAKTPSELNTLRKIAQDAAGSIDPSDARLGTIIVRTIDDSLDKLSSQIGGKFKEARALSQRAFKSQAITDMIENASHTASGMENGLRIEARKILKNKKKRRGFAKDELDALRKIEQGTTSGNIAKFLGKFGISEGQATSMLGASIGIGGGGALGSFFGPAGAAVGALGVPALGQIAKKTAQRITLNSTKFADDLVRSGKNAKEITKAYIKNTPISKRNVSDLTDLLLDANLSPSAIRGMPSSKSTAGKMIDDSIHFANEVKRRAKQAGSAAAIAAPGVIKQEQK